MRKFLTTLILGFYASYCLVQLGKAFHVHAMVAWGGLSYVITIFTALASAFVPTSPADGQRSWVKWSRVPAVGRIAAGVLLSYALWETGSWTFHGGLHTASVVGFMVTLLVTLINRVGARSPRATSGVPDVSPVGVVFGDRVLGSRAQLARFDEPFETSETSVAVPPDAPDDQRSLENQFSATEETGRVSIGLVDLDGLPYGFIDKGPSNEA